jgi:hypothetical protein
MDKLWKALRTFVDSAGGAALITVLFGGVAAQLISCDAQRRVQQREFNNAWLKARGDQALLARKEFVDGRRATLDEILRTAGTLSAASHDLVEITGPSFSMKGHTNMNSALILAEQTRVAKEFTVADLAWAPAQLRFSTSVAYFSAGNPAVRASWQDMQRSVDAMRTCASDTYKRWYLAGQQQGTYSYDPKYCRHELGVVDAKAAKLAESFGITSEQSGWDNPDSLKRKLNISN